MIPAEGVCPGCCQLSDLRLRAGISRGRRVSVSKPSLCPSLPGRVGMDAGCTQGLQCWRPHAPLHAFPLTVYPSVCRKHCPVLPPKETSSFSTWVLARPRALAPVL